MSLKLVAGVAGNVSPSPAPLPSAPLGAAVDNSVVDTVDNVDNLLISVIVDNLPVVSVDNVDNLWIIQKCVQTVQ